MIELKHIFGGYGSFQAVKDVSLLFPNGKVTAIIGPNGCGKSTLLKLCCGLLTPKQGDALAEGLPLGAMSRLERAKRIAFLPQSRTVPDIVAGALVLHGRFPWLDYPRIYHAQDKSIAEAAMRRVGVWDQRNKLLSNLSGGERQKAYLAMALAQNAGNVLLDEPTTYLDISHQLELLMILSELKREGKSVVAVLHDLSMALDVADQVAVMKDGGLLFAGTPEEIIASGAVEEAFGVKLTKETRYRFCLP